MRVKKKKENGWLLSVLVGAGFTFLLTGVLIAVLTGLILSERIGEGSGGKAIVCLAIIVVFVGGELAKRMYRVNDIRLPASVMGVYITVTVITGWMIEGSFRCIWANILAASVGCLISCALCIHRTGRNRNKKKALW